MAWVAPQTWVTGQIVTAADMNGDVRDNFLHLGGMTRLGTALSSLAASSELLPQWGAHAYHNANISHTTSGAWQTITTLNSEFWDTDSIHDASVNTGRLTFARAGMYSLHGSIFWESNATGDRGIRLTKNGVTIAEKFQTASAGLITQRISDDYYFAASDYLELGGYQNSGGALNMQANGVFGICLKAQLIGKSP